MGWWTEHCLHSLDELLSHLEILLSVVITHIQPRPTWNHTDPRRIYIRSLQVTMKLNMEAEVVWLHVNAFLKRTICALFRILWYRIYDQSLSIRSDPHGMP